MPVIARSEATIANILAAAASLFLSRNYADVTMDQIAAAAHVTKGALYHHFAGKEELYLEMMHTDLGEKKTLFTTAATTPGSCRERLRRLTKAFFDLPADRRELIKLVRRDSNVFGEPVRTELVRAYQACLPEPTERVIRDGIGAGELASGDPRLLSWHFVAMVEIVLARYADNLFDETEEKLDFVLDLFFSGAVADGRSPIA